MISKECQFCKRVCKVDKVGNLYDDIGIACLSHSATCMPYRRSKESKENTK